LWVGLLIFMIKSIGDDYKIYGLIIVKIEKKSLMLNHGLSNATFETSNHTFALLKEHKELQVHLVFL
jgi:hypothetical protein